MHLNYEDRLIYHKDKLECSYYTLSQLRCHVFGAVTSYKLSFVIFLIHIISLLRSSEGFELGPYKNKFGIKYLCYSLC